MATSIHFDVTLNVGYVNTKAVISASLRDRALSDDPLGRRTAYDLVNSELRLAMRAEPPGALFSKKHQRNGGTWDGFIYLIRYGTFPTGLLDLAVQTLENIQRDYFPLTYAVQEAFAPIPAIETALPRVHSAMLSGGIALRDYQTDSVRELLSNQRGVAHMATNSGKTLVIAACCLALDGDCLVIVPSIDLLYQTAEVITETTGLRTGLMGDGHLDYSLSVTVSTLQMLARQAVFNKKGNFVRWADPEFSAWANTRTGLMIDECHHASARTMYETGMHIRAPYRFGFSGTPLKRDTLSDLHLEALCGPIRTHVTNVEMIEAGYSATPDVRLLRIDAAPAPDNPKSYPSVYKAGIVENDFRNETIVREAILGVQAGRKVLVLVNQVRHLNNLIDWFVAYDHTDAWFITGRDKSSYRREALDAMRSDEPGIYVATTIFDEGVDVPSIDMLILCGAGMSHIKTLQRVGRGLRQKEGDNRLIVIDFDDQTHTFLRRHSQERRDTYLAEAFSVVDVLPTT